MHRGNTGDMGTTPLVVQPCGTTPLVVQPVVMMLDLESGPEILGGESLLNVNHVT